MTKENETYILEHNQMNLLEKHSSDCVSVRAFADLYGVHKHTVLNWIKAGKIPFFAAAHGVYKRYCIPADAVPPIIRPDRCA